MRNLCTVIAFVGAVVLSAPSRSSAQVAGFVVTLGADTVQVERISRTGNLVEGVVVLRSPTTVLINYKATLDAAGRLVTFEQRVLKGDGTPLNPDNGTSIMTVVGDSILRESGPRDNRVTARAAAPPGGAFPLGTIPVGTAFGIWEAAISRLRGKPVTEELTVNRVQAASGRLFVSRTPVLFSGADSVDMDYFGQGRAGFKFDSDGRLVRSDWANTTYQIKVVRVPSIELMTYSLPWFDQDKRGSSFGALSDRDTVTATVGSANLWMDYSRPRKRSRQIWGGVVPWDKVWRLGANQATQFKTDVDLDIGGKTVPAGLYTLWMRPSQQSPELVVSSLQRVFGTQYDPAKDFVRIPMTRSAAAGTVERLTIGIREGVLVVEWDDARYSVPIRVRQ